jgi:hypothetical protein
VTRIRAIVATAILLSGCGDGNVVTNTYDTAKQARAAEDAARWLPALVPAGGYDIREAHDQGGSGRRWGLFSFTPNDIEPFRARLGSETPLDGLRADAPPRIEWWPLLLRETLDGAKIAGTGLRGYRPAGEDLVVAVNWNQRRAYYWTPR